MKREPKRYSAADKIRDQIGRTVKKLDAVEKKVDENINKKNYFRVSDYTAQRTNLITQITTMRWCLAVVEKQDKEAKKHEGRTNKS